MTKKFSLVRGRAMRATRLNGCGNPVLGPTSVVATEGFISVAMTANTEAGEAISITNAAGKVCISDTPIPKFVNYSIEINFCGVDPDLVTLLTGQPVVLDASGEAVGFRQNSKIDVDLVGFSLELWAGLAGSVCDETGDPEYGYMLLPFVKGGVLGNFTVENGAINFTLTGAQTRDGSGWGVGPHDVVKDDLGADSPLLEPIDDGDHLHVQVTPVAPPSDFGTEALGVEATQASEGSPATLTPANSYAPADFTDLGTSGLTADPATAWSAGSYVTLRDGSRAHWDGSAWVSGAA